MAVVVLSTVMRTIVPINDLFLLVEGSWNLKGKAYGIMNPNMTKRFCPVFLTSHADDRRTMIM